jgi:outer membrane protein assembly factor BamA
VARLVLIVLSLLLMTAHARAADGPQAEGGVLVEQVDVEGWVRWHPDRVRFILQVRSGMRYGQRELLQLVSDDIKSIERLGPFSDVRGEPYAGSKPDSVRVRYRFRELPYIDRVGVEGIGYWKLDAYTKVLKTRAGGYLNDYLLENDRVAIMRKLQDDGRRFAQVTTRITPVPGQAGFVSVAFVVDAGTSVKVARVVYDGLPADLPRVWLHEETTLLNHRGTPFQRELLELDGSSLIRRIQDLGWLDARLVDARVEVADLVQPLDDRRRHGPDIAPDGERNDRVSIIYRLECGSRYRLGSVSFAGATEASEAEMLAAFQGLTDERTWPLAARVLFNVAIGAKLGDGHTLFTGDWFQADEVYGAPGLTVGAIERARRVISNRGHAQAMLDASRRLDTDKHIVHLTLQVTEGGIFHVGRVDIRGNDTTRDPVVRRAMMLHPGELWNDDDLDESRRQINRLGLFKNTPGRQMRITRRYPEDRPTEVDLQVDLTESETAKLSATGGYSSATKLFAQFGYDEDNFDALTGGWPFRGAGHQISASLYTSKERNAISASWTNPHFMDGPWSLTLNGTLDDSKLRDWDERKAAGGMGVGRNLFDNDLHLSLGYNLERLQVRNPSSFAPDDAIEGMYWLHTVRSGATYDRLDDRRLPTRGMLATASAAYTGPFNTSARYLDWRVRYDRFVPLFQAQEGGSTVFRLSGQWHEIDGMGGDPVPFYARFMGGGPSPAHRGYDYSDEGPRAPNKSGYDARIGGNREFLATGELSVPIQGINEGIRLVAFADTGWVWGEHEAVSGDDLRHAVGMGVRFPMSLPVSLDFAWLLNPRNGDKQTQVHFALGQMSF